MSYDLMMLRYDTPCTLPQICIYYNNQLYSTTSNPSIHKPAKLGLATFHSPNSEYPATGLSIHIPDPPRDALTSGHKTV